MTNEEYQEEESVVQTNETPAEQAASQAVPDGQTVSDGQSASDERAASVEQPDAAQHGDDAAAKTTEPAQLDDAAKIERLERQLEELKDQYLRKAADFENFRKRMNREKQEAIEYANTALLLDIIQVMDDFERALKSSEGADNWTVKDFQAFYEGVSMIEKRLSSQLENKWGLKRFDSAGEVFDPNRHEALMVEKSSEVSEEKVAEDLVKGYTLKDRVIRPAKVKVTMPE
ncbi:MAG: nucleotide exchange factor GrpE [Treponema sp.]|jgi:molecular chaperone GrpE|nr:nucleotide exchange factor GrpE [Treponema sp.]